MLRKQSQHAPELLPLHSQVQSALHQASLLIKQAQTAHTVGSSGPDDLEQRALVIQTQLGVQSALQRNMGKQCPSAFKAIEEAERIGLVTPSQATVLREVNESLRPRPSIAIWAGTLLQLQSFDYLEAANGIKARPSSSFVLQAPSFLRRRTTPSLHRQSRTL